MKFFGRKTWMENKCHGKDGSTKNMFCILYNQRDATHTMFFIIISALHVSGGFSAHHQELIRLYVQPWVLSCFPAVYRWCGWVGTEFQSTHTSDRLQESMTMPNATHSLISSWWWAEKPPETCRALIIIKNIVWVASRLLYKIPTVVVFRIVGIISCHIHCYILPDLYWIHCIGRWMNITCLGPKWASVYTRHCLFAA